MNGDAPASPARPRSTERRRLPNRRGIEIQDIIFRGRCFALSFGRFPDGSVCEVFVDPAKVASDAAEDSRDAGIMLSISLQHGVPISTLRDAVSRVEQGQPSSLTGYVLDLLAVEQDVNSGELRE